MLEAIGVIDPRDGFTGGGQSKGRKTAERMARPFHKVMNHVFGTGLEFVHRYMFARDGNAADKRLSGLRALHLRSANQTADTRSSKLFFAQVGLQVSRTHVLGFAICDCFGERRRGCDHKGKRFGSICSLLLGHLQLNSCHSRCLVRSHWRQMI